MASPTNTTQSAINWPPKYLPGTTSNFVTNETYAKDITAEQIWLYLSDVSKWESYYKNCESITPPEAGPQLSLGSIFKFSTFGFPVLTATVQEYTAPTPTTPGRISWSASLDGGEDEAVGVYHAWLVENVEGNRVRILTQESQNGVPARDLGKGKPNVMLLGHQDWVEGLVRAVKGEDIPKTNLGSVGFHERGGSTLNRVLGEVRTFLPQGAGGF